MTSVAVATQSSVCSPSGQEWLCAQTRAGFVYLPPLRLLRPAGPRPVLGVTTMAEVEEWVVESVFGFMRSPLWVAPVVDFLEQRCSVFDDEEENKLSYTEIHHEYKKLVEKLLESYLLDVGISEEQFQQALTSPFAQSHTSQTILQPVLAVEDFKLFKSVMVQKNIELQLQAIQIIQERNGVLPDCLTNGSDALTDLEQQEMELLSEAIRRSKEEYKQEQLRKKITEVCGVQLEPSESVHEESSEKSKSESKNRVSFQDSNSAQVAGDHITPAEVLRTVKQRTQVLEIPMETPSLKLKAMTNAEAAEAWLEQARREAGIFGDKASLTHVEKEQLRKRAEYLKQKRDKLMSTKKEPRNKPMKQNSEDQELKTSSSKKEMTEEEKKSLQKRRQLAEKLKEEVINK